jgi:hypothetical protein
VSFHISFAAGRSDKHQGTSESTSSDLSGNFFRHTRPQTAILSIS